MKPTMNTSAAVLAGLALVASGCASDDDQGGAGEQQDANSEATEAEPDPANQTIAEDAATSDDGQQDASSEDEALEPPDGPTGYSSLHTTGVAPAVQTDGEVAADVGQASGTRVPWLVRNGTDQPISRVQVSGAIVDADGETVRSGESQGVHPNVVEPGEVAFGFVYGGTDDLPDGATVSDPTVDYTEGVGEFENIVALDVSELDQGDDRFTGTVTNPHDVDVEGPLGVNVACLDENGAVVGVVGDFADRDTIEAGGEATFTIDLYGQELACEGTLAGASGYTQM